MAPDRFETDAGRDYVRVALVVCCLLAVVLAGTLVPVIASTGLGDTPLAAALPGEDLDVESGERPQSGANGTPGEVDSSGSPGGTDTAGGTGQGGLGALNPGDRTAVGGEIGTSNSPYRSQDAAPHFTVRSSQPAYWRTGSYGVYTGSGWVREGEASPYDGSLPQPGIEGDRVSYEVALDRPATALPTVWRPDTVTGVDGLLVTDRRAIQSREGVPAGTRFSGVSHRAPQSPDVLRATGADYPMEIERRYARLPDDVPDRVERFTARLTANASTSYETAQRIERWLESNKEYSLNASRTSDNIADTFVFEMERGYCEYFATSMVVMLRSQGIPARYTVGYSTGQQVGENTYRVRGMNAHAWVEVYFEDVGWVKFDPTPGSARIQQERESMRQQRPGEQYAPEEQGSPGEQFSPNDSETPADEEATDESTSNRTADGYDVALNRTAVPGASVTVTVTRDSEPVPGQAVLFNGDPIGVTGADGQVTGTIPYAEQLQITLQEAATGGTVTASRDAFFAAGAVDGPANVTYPVETNASVSVTGDVRPGATVTVTATVDDVPVRDGTVTVTADGREESRARTDSEGRASVTLPRESGPVTIGVERGPVSGDRTVTVPALSVAADPRLPLALPLTGVAVTVQAGDRPVSDVPVLVDGQQVTTTDVDGTATVSLPLADSATIGATSSGLEAQTTVSGLVVNLLLVFAVLGGAVGAGLYGARRSDLDPRAALGWLARLPALVARYGQLALVAIATRDDELLDRTLAALGTAPRRLRALVSDASLAALWASLAARVRGHQPGNSSATSGAGPGPDPSPRPGGADGSDLEPRLTVREAWTQLLHRVSVRRPRTKTPGELAEHAVESDGLPAEPVAILRDTFREVEYGSRSASERVERVQRAVEHIQRARADEREEKAGTSRGSD